MSNLIFKQNSKNQIGVGTNKIELTNSQSSALNIKKNDGSYSFLEFNTSSNTIGVGTKMETNALITFKNTTKINSITKGELIYLDSTGNWAGLGTTGIGSYIQVNSGGTGLQWTNNRPNISLISKSPSHTTIISSNSDNIILTFDETIIAGSGNIVLTPSSGSAITIDVTNTSLVSFSSNICTINPGNDLDSSGLRYTVTMNQGVIKNSIGNLFEGFSGSEYYFDSKDTSVPNISSLNPAHSSVISSNDANIIITFFETVVAGTGDIVLTPSSGSAITIDVTDSAKVTFGIDTCTINPGNDLDSSGLRYTVTMASGVIKDTSGNNFIGFSGSEYYFDSKDTTSPTISGLAIASDNSTNTIAKGGDVVTLTITTNEAISTPSVTFTSGSASINNSTITYNDSGSGTTWTAKYTVNSNDTDGAVAVSVTVTDLSGNITTSSSITSGSVTIDTTAPTINTYNPADEGTLSSNSSNITLIFNENITVGTGNIVLKQGGSTISTSFSCSGSTCTIDPSSDLSDLGLTYNVETDSTAIKDNAGNYFAGISGTTYQINSKLVDTTAPYITSGPSVSSNNSYNTLLTSSDTLTLIFTTNETINTPTIVINNQTISSGNISNSGNTWTATYSPQATHPVGPIDYYITYVDSAGNSSRQPSSGTTTINIAHYETNDLRHYMWKQNQQSGSETRGYVGYVNISCIIGSKTFYLVNLGGSGSGYLYFTTDPVNSNLSHWNVGSSGGGRNDEHTFKITYNSGNSNYTIIPDYSSWVSTTSPFTVDMAIYILYYPDGTNSNGSGIGDKLSTYPNWTGTFDITQVSGTTNKWNIYEAGTNDPLLFAQKDDGTYTVPRDYGYAGMHDSTRDKDNYYYHLSDYNTKEAIITFI